MFLTVTRHPSRRGALLGPVAQLVEQLTFNQWVTGSNPVGLTTFYYIFQLLTDFMIFVYKY